MNHVFYQIEPYFLEHTKRTKPLNMSIPHYHDQYEIYFLISGHRHMLIHDAYFSLHTGEIMLVKPFELHSTTTPGKPEHERYVLNFPPSLFDEGFTEEERALLLSVFDKKVLSLDLTTATHLLEDFKLLHTLKQKEDSLSQKMMKLRIISLLHSLASLPKQEVNPHLNLQQSIILDATMYIQEHYKEELTIKEVSNAVHLSEHYFCHLFKRVTGVTFLQYVNNMRLRNAHIFLEEQTLPLSKIAEESGFSSTAHMTRVFKKSYRMSPSEFLRKKTKTKPPT